MNYISEINSFYDWLETNRLSKSAIALWYALMHINNKANWIESFEVAISTLEFKTGFKRSELFEARNILQQKCRIEWCSRGGNLCASYKIIPFCVHNTDTSTDTNSNTNPTQKHTINKLNKTKQNNSFKEKDKKESFDFRKILIEDFNCDKQHVSDWLEVRKKKNASNTETALKNFINECQKNNFPVSEAVKICAEKSWRGFEYKWLENSDYNSQTNGNQWQKTNGGTGSTNHTGASGKPAADKGESGAGDLGASKDYTERF